MHQSRRVERTVKLDPAGTLSVPIGVIGAEVRDEAREVGKYIRQAKEF